MLDIRMRIRSAVRVLFGDQTPAELQGGPGGELIVAQDCGEHTLANAQGELHVAVDTTARAAVTAIPASTTSLFGLWNGNPEGSKSLEVMGIGYSVQAQAATTAFAGQAYINQGRQIVTAPVNLANIFPLNAAPNYTGLARTFATPTVVAADGHVPIGNGVSVPVGTQTVMPAFGEYIPVNGRIIIPPRKALALNFFATSASVTVIFTVWFRERFLKLA